MDCSKSIGPAFIGVLAGELFSDLLPSSILYRVPLSATVGVVFSKCLKATQEIEQRGSPSENTPLLQRNKFSFDDLEKCKVLKSSKLVLTEDPLISKRDESFDDVEEETFLLIDLEPEEGKEN
jgi:hypothetical protein